MTSPAADPQKSGDADRAGTSEPRPQAWRFILGVILVALIAGAFAAAFRAALTSALHAIAGASDVVSAMKHAPLWARFALPGFGGLLAGVIGLLVARAPAGHGVGDVMEAVVLGRVQLSLRVTLLKSIASWLAIVFGGSIGREGPLIQFGVLRVSSSAIV